MNKTRTCLHRPVCVYQTEVQNTSLQRTRTLPQMQLLLTTSSCQDPLSIIGFCKQNFVELHLFNDSTSNGIQIPMDVHCAQIHSLQELFFFREDPNVSQAVAFKKVRTSM